MTIFAIVLLLVGLFLALEPIIFPPAPPPPREVVVAAEAAEAYEVVSTRTITRPAEAIPPGAVTDPSPGTVFISKKPIQEEVILSYENAAQIGSEWRPATMDYEILSFPAEFDKMVAGQIRSGHRVNIYGYHREEEEDRVKPPVKLVAGSVWVVDARSSGGAEAIEATPTVGGGDGTGDGGGGLFSGGAGDRGSMPASIITVAAEPTVIWRIVDALGAQAYQAWVTLASNEPPVTPTNTPTPTPSPTPIPATPTPTPTATLNGDDDDGNGNRDGEDVIHVVLLNWLLDVVDPTPDELGMIPTTEDGYTFDYYGRQLTLEIENNTEDRLWAERWDQDGRATVLIDGTEGQQVWFEPGEGGTIQIELIEGARQATVVLMDTDHQDTCFRAAYVRDITVPDDTQMAPNQTFTKTWLVRNSGTCTWPEDAKLTFFRDERMSAPESVEVPALQPSEELEVSIPMMAPAEPGHYTGKWRMQAGDKIFGGEFWVVIQVGETEEASDGQ